MVRRGWRQEEGRVKLLIAENLVNCTFRLFFEMSLSQSLLY
jgi:hypothetical protein